MISQWVSILQAMTWEFRALAFYSYPKFLWGYAQAPHLLKDTENNLELLIRDTGQKNLNSLREKVIMKNSKAGWFYLKQGLPPLPACFPPNPNPQHNQSTMGVDGSCLRKNSAQLPISDQRREETKTKVITSEVMEVIFNNFFALHSLNG